MALVTNNENHEETIHELSWKLAQQDSTFIRTAVFMQEQQVSAADEWDGLDKDATHFLVRNASGEAMATARVLTENHANYTRYHIGRVAVLKYYRDQGVGHRLMRAIVTWCQTNNEQAQIYLHAQVNRQTFYQKLGFVMEGKEFMDAGIAHINMTYQTEFDHEHSLRSQ